MDKSKWTMRDFVEEMICIAEVIEIPGMKVKLDQIKREMQARFTEDELEEAGIVFA